MSLSVAMKGKVVSACAAVVVITAIISAVTPEFEFDDEASGISLEITPWNVKATTGDTVEEKTCSDIYPGDTCGVALCSLGMAVSVVAPILGVVVIILARLDNDKKDAAIAFAFAICFGLMVAVVAEVPSEMEDCTGFPATVGVGYYMVAVGTVASLIGLVLSLLDVCGVGWCRQLEA